MFKAHVYPSNYVLDAIENTDGDDYNIPLIPVRQNQTMAWNFLCTRALTDSHGPGKKKRL